MDPTHPAPPPRADESSAWHALVDGQLPPTEAQALREQLRDDEEAQATLAHWQAQRDRLHTLHQDRLHAPVPDALLAAALRATDRREQQAQWWRWGGMAASVLLAFVLGWAGRGQWPAGVPGKTLATNQGATLVTAEPAQRFAQQASVAHAVYQPEVRHPVEVTAAQQDHLVQWLSKRLDRPLKVPVLGAQGYELVGGRLLPGDTGVRAQFMYQNSAGQRITLYLGALAPTSPRPASDSKGDTKARVEAPEAAPVTAFQFTHEGPVPGFYWTDAGFGYALSGQLSRPELLSLATAVYQQLSP
ncbi:anti-sigma factor [Acidovorax sp. D2M1]|uniref:Anti-sigma factor n=1 Tax=Acidovorax benzenivorans TaxID=2987520 RepID=A0ABT5RY39_9BURK|nr:anti-sigma factor [Acidovorax benzenivorans]MDD2178330.1 anti-sigma factor [Acidovorax benzenivorans]